MSYPKIMDLLTDREAESIFCQMMTAAEAMALPGFEGDPRGMGVVEMWRRKRLGLSEGIDWSILAEPQKRKGII